MVSLLVQCCTRFVSCSRTQHLDIIEIVGSVQLSVAVACVVVTHLHMYLCEGSCSQPGGQKQGGVSGILVLL